MQNPIRILHALILLNVNFRRFDTYIPIGVNRRARKRLISMAIERERERKKKVEEEEDDSSVIRLAALKKKTKKKKVKNAIRRRKTNFTNVSSCNKS